MTQMILCVLKMCAFVLSVDRIYRTMGKTRKVPKITQQPVMDVYELKNCLIDYFGPDFLYQGEEITEVLFGEPVAEGLLFNFHFHKLDEEYCDPRDEMSFENRRNLVRKYLRMNVAGIYDVLLQA